MSEIVLERRDPISTLQYVLETLEKLAIDAGSHPVLIHEGLEALDRLRKPVAVAQCPTCGAFLGWDAKPVAYGANERIGELEGEVLKWKALSKTHNDARKQAETKLLTLVDEAGRFHALAATLAVAQEK